MNETERKTVPAFGFRLIDEEDTPSADSLAYFRPSGRI
jgi:hypothetical protein